MCVRAQIAIEKSCTYAPVDIFFFSHMDFQDNYYYYYYYHYNDKDGDGVCFISTMSCVVKNRMVYSISRFCIIGNHITLAISCRIIFLFSYFLCRSFLHNTAYGTLYESSIAYGIRKALMAQQRVTELDGKLRLLASSKVRGVSLSE